MGKTALVRFLCTGKRADAEDGGTTGCNVELMVPAPLPAVTWGAVCG